MAAVAICLHNKFGFCKHGEKCRNRHIQEICNNDECKVNECARRHPKECRYFRLFKRCKFGEYCAFSHEIPLDPAFEELKVVKQNLKDLEKEVRDKNEEIKDILKNIEKSLNALNLLKVLPNSTTKNNISTNKSTLTMVSVNPSNTEKITNTSITSAIPQLDGEINADSSTTHSPFECENCKKSFESEETLKSHTDLHEWGCDDCYLCFTTKYNADLHELEHHGHELDSIAYIRDHIPQSTKNLFAAGHRQR